MIYKVSMNMTVVDVDLPGVSEAAFDAVGELIDRGLARPEVKNRDVIKDAFLAALRSCPTANASDLWHHVVYRLYLRLFNRHRPQNPEQSWKRASGEALEFAVEKIYEPVLAGHGVRMRVLVGRPRKLAALTAMGIDSRVGSDKLDLSLHLGDDEVIFGGVHVKASLAERISDDVPCSREMMTNGYFSPIWTLDVKSFPPPDPEPLVNRGELGAPETPSEKRKYIESHGSFDHLFTANARSRPSMEATPSGKRVIVVDPAVQPDPFAREVLARADAFRKRGRAAAPPPGGQESSRP